MMHRKKSPLFLLLTAVLLGCSHSPKAPTLSAHQKQQNMESYDYVWTTIQDSHYDTTFGGLDWPGVYDELKPRMEAAVTMGEARAVLEDMISRLGLSHFAIIPREIYSDMDDDEGPIDRSCETGLHLALL